MLFSTTPCWCSSAPSWQQNAAYGIHHHDRGRVHVEAKNGTLTRVFRWMVNDEKERWATKKVGIDGQTWTSGSRTAGHKHVRQHIRFSKENTWLKVHKNESVQNMLRKLRNHLQQLPPLFLPTTGKIAGAPKWAQRVCFRCLALGPYCVAWKPEFSSVNGWHPKQYMINQYVWIFRFFVWFWKTPGGWPRGTGIQLQNSERFPELVRKGSWRSGDHDMLSNTLASQGV